MHMFLACQLSAISNHIKPLNLAHNIQAEKSFNSLPAKPIPTQTKYSLVVAGSPRRICMLILREPHCTSSKHHQHGEAVDPSGSMGLVDPLNPSQGGPIQGVG
jgi:hypothetical protein